MPLVILSIDSVHTKTHRRIARIQVNDEYYTCRLTCSINMQVQRYSSPLTSEDVEV